MSVQIYWLQRARYIKNTLETEINVPSIIAFLTKALWCNTNLYSSVTHDKGIKLRSKVLPWGGINLHFWPSVIHQHIHLLVVQSEYEYRVNTFCSVAIYCPAFASTHCTYWQKDDQGGVDLDSWLHIDVVYITCPQSITHPSTNYVTHRATTMIQTMRCNYHKLLPSHTVTKTLQSFSNLMHTWKCSVSSVGLLTTTDGLNSSCREVR